MKQHLGLGKPIEIGGYKYICPVCKQKLSTLRAPWTNWQEWYFTENDKRHFKNRCNFQESIENLGE